MKATTRRTIEMSKRVLNFSRAHPNASAGYAAALSRLEQRLTRADQLAALQQDGIDAARTAVAQKRNLRRRMRRTHLVHLARVAEAGVAEVPDLAQKFVLTRDAVPYLAFRTAARAMLAEAQTHKEILIKYGLLDSVLESLAGALDQFDQAVEKEIDGRRVHVGASAELDIVAEELIQVVKLMDGTNHYRLADDGNALAAWESASNTFGPPRPAAVKPTPDAPPPAGGQSSVA